MKPFIKMALFNVLRNRRRSFLVCLIIGIGLTFMFTVRGILNALQSEIVAGITQAESGDLQITRKGYRNALPTKSMDFLFVFDDVLRAKIQTISGIEAVTGRITYGGLINHQATQTTTPFIAMAIDPENELLVCPKMKELIQEGTFIQPGLEQEAVLDPKWQQEAVAEAPLDEASDDQPAANHDLKMQVKEYHQIIVGKSMRDGFVDIKNMTRKAAVGDEIILLTQDQEGSQRSIQATLTGIADARNPMANKSIVYTALATAQKMLNAKDNVTQVVIRLKPGVDRFVIRDQLNIRLASEGLVTETWDEFNPFFVTIMLFQNAIFSIVTGILILIVMVAIMITTFMTVSERIREIGTFMAIGYRRGHILLLFLMESGFLGLAGGVVGAGVGLLLMFVMYWVGIPFVIPGSDYPFMIRPWVHWYFVLFTVVMGMASAVLATLYPARQASAMTPLKALGHI